MDRESKVSEFIEFAYRKELLFIIENYEVMQNEKNVLQLEKGVGWHE